jgi:hypothetical protein
MLVLGLLFGGAAACGDDDDGGSDSTEAPAEGASDDVEDYCTEAEDLGQQLQDAADDPTGADAQEIQQQASELAAEAQDLITANPDDVDRINECSEALQVTP